MAGVIRWRKASILSDMPDANHVYIGVDSVDGLLYLKNSNGDIFKYPTSDDIAGLVDDALAVATFPADSVSIDDSALKVVEGTDLQTMVNNLDISLLNVRTTGLRYGGGIVNLGSGVIRILAGSGAVLDNATPDSPLYYRVSWAQTDINLSASDNVYYIYVNSSGTVSYTTSVPSGPDYRDNIYLHRVSIRSGLVSGTTSIVNLSQQVGSAVYDIWTALGSVKSGLTLSSNGSNLTFQHSSGFIYIPGSNFYTNPKDPNRSTISAQAPVTFRHVTQNGTQGSDTTVLSVGSYDVSGTVTAIPGSGNVATIFQVMLFPGSTNYRIFYGQTVYSTIADALSALRSGSYNPTIPSTYQTAAVLGWIVAAKGATSLADGVQVFVTANKFGGVGGAISTSGASTTWGSITGTLSAQSDLQSALDAKLTIPTTSGFWHRFPSFPTVLNYFVKEIDIFSWVASSTLGDLTIVQSGSGATTEHADITNTGAGINSTEKAIGVARTSLGTTSTGRAYFGFGIINGVNFALGNHSVKFGVRYTLDILADATDDYTVHIGHVGSYTSAPTTGVFFRYNYNVNGGRWECCVGTGTITAADTGVAPTARTYQVLEIDINTAGTQALFYIDGILVGTASSGIPTATGLFPGVANFKSAGTSARLFFTDAIYLAVEKLSVR